MPIDSAESVPSQGARREPERAQDDGGPVSLGRCEPFAAMMRFFLWGLRNARRVEDLPPEDVEKP